MSDIPQTHDVFQRVIRYICEEYPYKDLQVQRGERRAESRKSFQKETEPWWFAPPWFASLLGCFSATNDADVIAPRSVFFGIQQNKALSLPVCAESVSK